LTERYSLAVSEFSLPINQQAAQLRVPQPSSNNLVGMKIQATDKLAILQANDHFRDWRTLDDKRVCVLCDRQFTGHDVLVATAGKEVHLHCPTHNCKSGVHHWVYPGNPLLSDATYEDWWQALGSSNDAFRGAGAGGPSPQPI
jgi:hypothetical protein